MSSTNRDPSDGTDPIGEIIRAAGPRAAPPAADYDRVFAATHAAWQNHLGARRRRWLAVAASLAVLAGAAALTQLLVTGTAEPAGRLAVAAGIVEMATDDGWLTVAAGDPLPAGARLRTGGDDGGAVRLAAGGVLRFAADSEFVLGQRTQRLNAGRLYFDSSGRSDPIEIRTTLGNVRDIGTQFEVLAGSDRLRVRVRSGRVIVSRSDTVDQATEVGAGTELSLTGSGRPIEVAIASDDPEWAWAETLAIAPSASVIGDYFDWIAHETGKRVRFGSSYARTRARSETFTGDPAGLSPMEVLNLIVMVSDFRYTLPDDGTILIERSDEP